MKAAALQAIRRTVPRHWRNSLRRPRVTLARLVACARHAIGRSDRVSLTSDLVVRCHPICRSEFEVFRRDGLQMTELTEFVRHCQPRMRLLDVGANYGVFTLAALHYGAPGARAVCVEPSPSAAHYLRHNLSLNGHTDKVEVVQLAAGARTGRIRMLSTGAGGADYFVIPPEPRPDSVSVPQVDMSSLCQSLGFAPTHIKLDVEGYEAEALEGLRSVLLEASPLLFVELHGDLLRRRGVHPNTVLSLLRSFGYSRWRLGDRLIGPADCEALNYNIRLIAYAT